MCSSVATTNSSSVNLKNRLNRLGAPFNYNFEIIPEDLSDYEPLQQKIVDLMVIALDNPQQEPQLVDLLPDLIKHKCNLNQLSQNKKYRINSTFLIVACFNKRFNIIKKALEITSELGGISQKFLDLNRCDDFNETLFTESLEGGDLKIVQLLLSDPRIDLNHFQIRSRDLPSQLRALLYQSNPIRLALLQTYRLNYDLFDVNTWNNFIYFFFKKRDHHGHIDLDLLEIILSSKKFNRHYFFLNYFQTMAKIEFSTPYHYYDLDFDRYFPTIQEYANNAPSFRKNKLKKWWKDEYSADIFALTVFLCDDFLRIIDEPNNHLKSYSNACRFFQISQKLPLDLQMVLANRSVGSFKDFIATSQIESALHHLSALIVRNHS